MNHNQPTFQKVFGTQWEVLPTIMKKHYANRPFSNDVTIAKGKLNVIMSPWFWVLSPLLKAFNLLVPKAGNNIPVTVKFSSERHSNAFKFDRQFNFPDSNPINFQSTMYHQEGCIVYEVMNLGITWKMDYLYTENKVQLKHRGFAWRVFGYYIPMPVSWIFGKGYAEELAIDDHHFKMDFTITHPIFGVVYGYNGEFRID